ncbi:MAG: tetratricopeptide repeat protein [Planctomycetes bacterium]|nr:tetratricopeptide repeat protein [Planctomycetota bacterium]
MSFPSRHRPGPPADVRPGTPRPLRSAAPSGDAVIDRWLMPVLKVLAVVLLCGWCYSPATKGTWLWDDDQAVTQNPITQGPFSFRKIWVSPVGDAFEAMTAQGLHWLGYGPPPPPPAPCAFGETDYWPLTQTGFWMQWHLFGPDSAGYHVVNTALHAIGALMLWRLMTVMRLPGGWFAALLFAVHPLAVESVTWVSELKNVLSLPFMLLAAIHFVRADDRVTGADGATARLGWWVDYAISLVCFLMAMFAKTSVVMLPPTLLLYVWWKRNWIGLADLVRTAPYFLISLVYGLITIYFQHGRAIGAETILVGGFWSRLAMASLAVPFYLGKVFLPYGLMPIYPRWEIDVPKLWHFLPLPVFAGLAAWCWVNRQTWGRHVLFAIGFFVLMLLPILGFITISYMRITWVADHFVYAPMIGPLMLAAAAATAWAHQLEPRERLAAAGGAAALVGILAIGSFRYSFVWSDEEPMWTYTLLRHAVPCRLTHCGCWQANSRLGARKYSQGKLDEAFFHFSESKRLRPDLAETHNNYGNALASKGRIDEALAEFRKAADIQPQIIVFQNNLAMTCMQSGRVDEAKQVFAKMLQQWPDDPTLYNNYAFALHRSGDAKGAIASLQRALSIKPDYEEAKKNLATIREELAKTQSAVGLPIPAARPEAGAPPAERPAKGGPVSPTMAPPSPTLGPPPLPGATSLPLSTPR